MLESDLCITIWVKGGKSIDEVLNAGKDKAYHLKRLDQVDLSVVHPARIPLTGGVKVDNPDRKAAQHNGVDNKEQPEREPLI